MQEEWRSYKTPSCEIEVSNFGNVRGNKWHNKKVNVESLVVLINGRRCIKNHHFPIFQLVWFVFNGEKPKGYSIHHIDHNKLNDKLDNLVMLSRSEHAKHHALNRTKEHQEKLNKSCIGRKASDKAKQKMSKQRIGRHWFNNGTEEIFCYECPVGFTRGRLVGVMRKVADKHIGNIVWNKGKVGLQQAWNKGITKDSNESMKKISEAKKEYWKNKKGNVNS